MARLIRPGPVDLAGAASAMPAPAAFAARNARRCQRSITLVTTALAALGRRGARVSLATIMAETRALDPAGQGVSESTILRNPACHAAYAAAAPARPRSRSARSISVPPRLARATNADLIDYVLAQRDEIQQLETCLRNLAADNARLRVALEGSPEGRPSPVN